MTHDIDYTTVTIPKDKPPEEYHYTERRAEILDQIFAAGTPAAMNQTRLAERYDVDQSQISYDIDALGEFVADALGSRAKLTTRAAFQRVVNDLLEENDWRAKKAAWDIVMDWSEWLADRGELEREPRRSEVDVRSRNVDVAYQIVRAGDDEELPTIEDDETVNYEAIGFTSSPPEIPVDSSTDRGEGDE